MLLLTIGLAALLACAMATVSDGEAIPAAAGACSSYGTWFQALGACLGLPEMDRCIGAKRFQGCPSMRWHPHIDLASTVCVTAG